MKNEELSSAEKKTEPANMSAGAEMLIERMKTNPEDFKHNGRFYRVVEASNQNMPHQGWVSARDALAIRAAYEEHIQEADFTEWVYNEIFNPEEPEPAKRGQLLKDLIPGVNDMFAKAYAEYRQEQYRDAEAKLKYKATDRYATGWDGKPLTDPWKKK